MNDKIKKYNLRQLGRIKDKITCYTQNKLSLYDLISDLEALADCIEEQPIEGFVTPWSWLDGVCASICIDKRNYHTFEETAIICDALIKLLEVVDNYKKKYLADVQEDESDLEL